VGQRGEGPVELRLLGCFTLVMEGASVPVPRAGQRVLARVALSGGAESRSSVASTLWPEHTEVRAQANLRGAVWRMPGEVRRRLLVGASSVALDDGWRVDVADAERVAPRGPVAGAACPPPAELFRHDLLPDWDEPWLLVERERHRQLRLHALEDLARSELDAGRPLGAIDCALLAVAAEPLRESAQALVVRGHVAAGNRAAARDGYDRFRRLLAAELGVAPSAELTALVGRTGLAG
jgi:DNA-binding SARP family transcriptional activator